MPDVEKNVGKIKLALGDVGGIALSAGGVFSTTENQDTLVQSNYTGYMLNAARRYQSPDRSISSIVNVPSTGSWRQCWIAAGPQPTT